MNEKLEEHLDIINKTFNPFYDLDEALNESKDIKFLQLGKPYMVRKDGRIFECGSTHPYVLGGYTVKSLIWFYDHTENKEIKSLIHPILISIHNNPKAKRHFNISEQEMERIEEEISEINTLDYIKDIREIRSGLNRIERAANQEFLRVRTGDRYYGNIDKGIYFRVSSDDFNWFPLIEKIILDNRGIVDTITIERDHSGRVYSHKGIEFNEMPVDIFLGLSGNPIIEDLDETLFKSKANRATHYLSHVNWLNDEEEDDELFPSMSIDEYDSKADILSREVVTTSEPFGPEDVVGYFGSNRRRIKYRKSTGEIVVYKADQGDVTTIAYYKTKPNDPSSYIRKLKMDYLRELRPGDDWFNK